MHLFLVGIVTYECPAHLVGVSDPVLPADVSSHHARSPAPQPHPVCDHVLTRGDVGRRYEVSWHLYRSFTFLARLEFMSRRTLALFSVINIVFLSITVAIDLIYKAHVVGSADASQDVTAIDAELLVFAIGFISQVGA
jgi:hypothetical protein